MISLSKLELCYLFFFRVTSLLDVSELSLIEVFTGGGAFH